MLKQLLKEPLVHFLLIGAALFAAFGLTNETASESDSRLVVSQADVDRLVASWQRSWNRSPAPEEVDQLVASFVQEEILYREAVAMGLDKDDPVVRRRMAQKLKFLFEDIAAPSEPGEQELKAYLDEHSDKYLRPASFSFSQIYFSVDRRGAGAVEDAQQALAQLQQGDVAPDPQALGDSLMLEADFAGASEYDVTRTFGKEFTDQLAQVNTGQWQGPLRSGYGVHLVYLRERIAAELPPLAAVRDRVAGDYVAEQQRQANEKFYEGLRQRYNVVVEANGAGQSSVALKPTAHESGTAVP